jgi:hypothetical protein
MEKDLAMRFECFTIKQNEDGFYWQEGGYYDTIEECQEDIADWNRRPWSGHEHPMQHAHCIYGRPE